MKAESRPAKVSEDPLAALELDDSPSPRASSVRSAVRVLSILSSLGPRESTLTSIANTTGIPLPTTLRLVRTLEGEGFVKRTKHGGYLLGDQIVRLGYMADTEGPLRWRIRQAVYDLQRAVEETASFWVEHNGRRVCIEVSECSKQVRWTGHVGLELPLHRGAGGKVLLAFMSDSARVTRILRDAARHDTSWSQASHDRLVAELDAVREQGFATSDHETSADSWGVGAPITLSGVVLGALSVGIPYSQPRLDSKELVREACCEFAARVTEELGAIPARPLS